jgi:WD40 repeat protein
MPVVRYSPDSKRLLTVGDMYSGVVQLWDVDGRKELLQIAGPKVIRGVKDISFLTNEWALLSPDGKTLYLPTREEKSTRVDHDGQKADWYENLGRIRRWDLTTRKELEAFTPPAGWGNMHADLSPDGRSLYSIEHKARLVKDGATEQLAVWDTATGKRVVIGPGRMGVPPRFLSGDRLANPVFADGKLTVRVHSLPDGKEVVAKTLPDAAEWVAMIVDVSADGKLLAVNLGGAKGKQTATLLLDATTLEEVARWTGPAKPIYFGHTDGWFTPDGKRFVAIDGENSLYVFDVAAKKVARTVKLEGTPIHMKISPDGRWFATHWKPDDPNKFANEITPDPRTMPQPRVVLVDLNDPESKPLTLIAPRGTAWGMAFRPDGKQLALGGTGGVHLFDLTKLK